MKFLSTLVLLIIGLDIIGAQNVLQGRITESNGQPLAGVTILERGTSNGTTSTTDGSYSVNYTRTDAVLVYSYTGFVTQELRLNGRPTMDVIMESDLNLLDQVVVVGSRRANRVQTETPVPVDVINLSQVGVTTARADLTSLLNYAAPSFNYNKQSGSDGADHIDLATLRGLGPDQTLVLVNGKRRHQTAFVAVFGTRGRGNSGTDLSALPTEAIDRVEILRDGASAQYGSDAIAGVINIILKKDIRHFSANVGYSGYYDKEYNPAFPIAYEPARGQYISDKKFDGATFSVGANYGLPVGKKGGFANVTLNYDQADKTFRQELKGVLPLSIYRRAHGDGSLQRYGGMLNMEIPLRPDDRFTFYVFGGYDRKESDAYAFTRNFSEDSAPRFPTDANGNLIEVPGIIMTASDGTKYFNPHIQTEIQDGSVAAGIKGKTSGDWNWDLSNNLGQNQFHFFGDKTFNAGLGTGQTHFDDGGFTFLQNTSNLNISKLYTGVASGLNLAFGGEFRLENYQIDAGEAASYSNYDTLKATGSQGFPGYQPSDVVNADRSCAGVYADLELDVTERFLIGGAVRFENYSDFGSTINYKVVSRLKIGEHFNVRGSYSTGFRAPSLQQINFSSTFTNVQGGLISEVKIAPNTSRITRAAGIPELTQEKAENASIGFSIKPFPALTFTVDAYQVKVKDRVVLSGQFSASDASLNPALTTELNNLNVSSAQFFANAVNTTNRGVDVVIDFNKKLEEGRIRALFTANFQKMTLDKINVPTLLDDTPEHRITFLNDREQTFILASAPPVKFAINLEYGHDVLTLGMRVNYFGQVVTLGYGDDFTGINPMVPTDANDQIRVPDRYVYHPKIAPDVYAGLRFNRHFTLHVGVDNFLNVHPDLGYVPAASGYAFYNETGGPWDTVQMGGNGLRLFTRLAVDF